MATKYNPQSHSQTKPSTLRDAPSKSVLMRALMRFQGHDDAVPITVREISATGMKASAAVAPFPGGKIEIGLRNLGAVPATVIWASAGELEVAFDRIINPDEIQLKVSGTYERAPEARPNLRRI